MEFFSFLYIEGSRPNTQSETKLSVKCESSIVTNEWFMVVEKHRLEKFISVMFRREALLTETDNKKQDTSVFGGRFNKVKRIPDQYMKVQSRRCVSTPPLIVPVHIQYSSVAVVV